MPIVLIPSILRPFTGGKERLAVDASTVDEAVAALAEAYPEAGERLSQALRRRYVVASVGGQDIRDLAEGQTKLGPKDELFLLWAVAGG